MIVCFKNVSLLLLYLFFENQETRKFLYLAHLKPVTQREKVLSAEKKTRHFFQTSFLLFYQGKEGLIKIDQI